MDKKTISKIKEISPNLTKEEKISEIKKILEEKNEPELVIIKDIKEVLTKLADILGVVSNIENKEVKTYEEELQNLVDSISELKETITDKDMIVNIPLDDLSSSIIRVENAVKSIKFPEITIPETVVNEVSFKDDEIIESIKKIPQFPIEDIKKMFSSIIDILSNTPDFNYERLERKLDGVIKAIGKIDLSVYGGGGNSYVRNAKSEIVNPSTEDKQNTIIGYIDGVETLLGDIKSNQTNLTQKTQIFDSWGDKIGSTMLDQLMIAESHRISGGIFNGTTVDTNFYTTSLSANGTATIASSLLDLATTTDSGSSALLYANSLGRYVGANMNSYRAIKRFGDTGKTNNTRQFGVFNDSSFTDGFFFQLSGTTFSVVARTASSDTVINSGSFNGDVTSWTVDNIFHTFEIIYTNRRIQFYINSILIHTFTETTSVISGTRNFRPFARNFNTGVGSVCHLYTQVMTISKHGSAVTQAKTFLQEGLTNGVLLKYGPGVLHLLNLSGVTNSSVVTIYDGLTTAGRKIWTSGTMGPQTAPFSMSLDGAGGTPFDTGLYLTITGAASNAFVKYE